MESNSPELSAEHICESLLKNPERARQMASDANTAPDILTELATNGDRQTCALVVSNPNTPIKVLYKLGAEFPDEFLENPIWLLLSLENPEYVQTFPLDLLKLLLSRESVPAHFLVASSHHTLVD